MDEDGPFLDVNHGWVVHEVEPVGVVLADVVHRHEHGPLTLARQLDVALVSFGVCPLGQIASDPKWGMFFIMVGQGQGQAKEILIKPSKILVMDKGGELRNNSAQRI